MEESRVTAIENARKQAQIVMRAIGKQETVMDAGHPRFVPPETDEEIRQYEHENMILCIPCKEYFQQTIPALEAHFLQSKVHASLICVYCKGPVFEYHFRGEKYQFHRCQE